MVHSVTMLLTAAALAIFVFSPTTVKGTQDLAGLLGRLQNVLRPRHCGHVRQAGQTADDMYLIYHEAARDSGQFVYCVMESNDVGWTVIQERGQDNRGIFAFYKNWSEYASEFGIPTRELWIGNRAIHALTSGEEPMTLRVVLSNSTHNVTIDYGRFKISSENDNFRLSVDDYKGPEGWDALTVSNGRPFQTFDRGANENSGHMNCAAQRRGAWWYTSNCEGANLNGVNFDGEHLYPGNGIQWFNRTFDGVDWSRYSYNHVRMMIKPA